METISVGKFVATFGLAGQLILKHGLGRKTALKGLEVLFIEDKSGSRLPHFVTGTKQKNHEEVFITLEGINSKEAAQALLKKTVWFKKEDFEKFAAPAASISLIGFQVVEKNKVLGEITEIIEQAHQVLCIIIIEEKEVLIPLHEESLIGIDRAKKRVHVQLPEGLLDVYL